MSTEECLFSCGAESLVFPTVKETTGVFFSRPLSIYRLPLSHVFLDVRSAKEEPIGRFSTLACANILAYRNTHLRRSEPPLIYLKTRQVKT